MPFYATSWHWLNSKLRAYGNPVLGITGGHCGNVSEHTQALDLRGAGDRLLHALRQPQPRGREGVIPQLHLQAVGGGLPQASARFLLIDKRLHTPR